jgi:uncharacterized protein YjbI with pentapeptide repeats
MLSGIEMASSDFTGASFVSTHFGFEVIDASDVNFTNANFTTADFSAISWDIPAGHPVTMTGATFTSATFFAADFSTIDLSAIATFTGAYVNSTSLFGAFNPATHGAIIIAPGANLTGADFSKAWFGVPVDFATTTLVNAIFTKVAINSTCNFSSVDLTGAHFAGAELGEANFTGANLTNADFTDANLRSISLSSGTVFTGAKLVRANLTGMNLASCAAAAADFTHATILSATMTVTGADTATWTGAFKNSTTVLAGNVPADAAFVTVEPGTSAAGKDLTGIWLGSTTFANADFSNANLSNSHLVSTTFAGASATTGANLAGANFTGAHVQAVMEHADLTNANFSNAQMQFTVLEHANLTGANFTGTSALLVSFIGANATNANFTNANLGCAIFVFNPDTQEVGPTTFTGATIANTTCADFSVQPAGSAADVCEHHANLFAPGGDVAVPETTRCFAYIAVQLGGLP